MTDISELYHQAYNDYGKVLRACFGNLEQNLNNAVAFACASGNALALTWMLDHCIDRAAIIKTATICGIGRDSIGHVCFLMDSLDLYTYDVALIRHLCDYDCVDILDHLIRTYGELDIMTMIKIACELDSLRILKYLLNKYQPSNVDEIFQHACRFGNIVAEYLVMEYPYISTDRFRVCIDHVDNDVIQNACKHDNISILKHVFDMQKPDNINRIFQYACEHSNDAAKWLIIEYPDIDIHADDCQAFKNACKFIPELGYNDNFDLLINLSRYDDISYHNASEYDLVNNNGRIISVHPLGDIWKLTKFCESYNLYMYSPHDHEIEFDDLLLHTVYVHQIQKAMNRSKKPV